MRECVDTSELVCQQCQQQDEGRTIVQITPFTTLIQYGRDTCVLYYIMMTVQCVCMAEYSVNCVCMAAYVSYPAVTFLYSNPLQYWIYVWMMCVEVYNVNNMCSLKPVRQQGRGWFSELG